MSLKPIENINIEKKYKKYKYEYDLPKSTQIRFAKSVLNQLKKKHILSLLPTTNNNVFFFFMYFWKLPVITKDCLIDI